MHQKNFRIHSLNIENFKGHIIDDLMKSDSKYADDYDSIDEPYALYRHISESSRFQLKLIKMEMAQVDPLFEPELYRTLLLLAECELKLWILSTESVKNYEMFLDGDA
jgi:hypothetical protein